MSKLKKISVRLPESYVRMMELLIKMRIFSSKSEIIRKAIDQLIKKEYRKYTMLNMDVRK